MRHHRTHAALWTSLTLAVAAFSTACFSPHSSNRYEPPLSDAGTLPTGGQTSQQGHLSGSLQVIETTGASIQQVPREAVKLESIRSKLRIKKSVRLPETKEPSPMPPRAPEEIAGEIIVRFEEGELEPKEALVRLHVDGYTLEHGGYASPFLHLIRGQRSDGRALTIADTRELAQELKKKPGVRFVELNRLVHAQSVPNDPLYDLQWHYPMMNLPAAWDLTQGASSLVVADIDTGILNNPDLAANVLPGFDMISEAPRASDGDGRDSDPTDPGGDLPQGVSSWHGTHTAGTIAAISNNGLGIAGVAPGVRLVPIRALGKGGGTSFDIAASIYWAVGAKVPGTPVNANPARVINMSLGGPSAPSKTYQDAIDAAVASGAVVVVSAGNDHADSSDYTPCNQNNVICVGAVGFDGRMTDYSNYGAAVDVMAPGGDLGADLNGDGYGDGVLSTYADPSGAPGFEFQQGTSMAAPHVTGLVALMLSVNPSLTSAQVESIIKSTANPSFQCSAGCGAGLADAYAAVLAAKGQTPTNSPQLSVATTSITLHRDDAISLAVSNVGGQTLNVTATPGGALADRIEFEGSNMLSIAPGKSSAFHLSVNSSGLADGEYTGSVTLKSNGGTKAVAVTLKLGGGMSAHPAVVMAVYEDAKGDWLVASETRSDPAQQHAWRLDVPPGSYFLIATVDVDGDEEYFEDNEPVGFYRSLEDPQAVTVAAGQTLDNLSFRVLPHTKAPPSGPAIGDACTSSSECPMGATCAVNWPGGYCTQACDPAACPGTSICVAFDNGGFCMEACPAPGTQSTCRSGYRCAQLKSGKGACVPQ